MRMTGTRPLPTQPACARVLRRALFAEGVRARALARARARACFRKACVCAIKISLWYRVRETRWYASACARVFVSGMDACADMLACVSTAHAQVRVPRRRVRLRIAPRRLCDHDNLLQAADRGRQHRCLGAVLRSKPRRRRAAAAIRDGRVGGSGGGGGGWPLLRRGCCGRLAQRTAGR